MGVSGEIRKLFKSSNCGFLNSWPIVGFDVGSTSIKGNETPVVSLFNFTGDWMVVTLSAFNPDSKNGRADGLGDRLVLIVAFEKKPGCSPF